MNLLGTILSWFTSLTAGHGALPTLLGFLSNVVADEVPVADKYVATVVSSLPADILASKPLVAISHVASAAAKQAEADGINVGVGAMLSSAVPAVASAQAAFTASQQPAQTTAPCPTCGATVTVAKAS